MGNTIDMAAIIGQWPELVRLKASIEAGVTIPSVILRKLAAAGPGNALSRALRAVGRLERTLFTLQWLSDPELRQRSHAGLNKGEASNSLRRAVFFHRQGEIRDRTFENQSFRASGLSLITAAIVHWNTVYLERAVQHIQAQGSSVPDDLLPHVAPLGWEHIALTGDYVWAEAEPTSTFRPLNDAVPQSQGRHGIADRRPYRPMRPSTSPRSTRRWCPRAKGAEHAKPWPMISAGKRWRKCGSGDGFTPPV
jgi:hypothetical protein